MLNILPSLPSVPAVIPSSIVDAGKAAAGVTQDPSFLEIFARNASLPVYILAPLGGAWVLSKGVEFIINKVEYFGYKDNCLVKNKEDYIKKSWYIGAVIGFIAVACFKFTCMKGQQGLVDESDKLKLQINELEQKIWLLELALTGKNPYDFLDYK